MDDSVVLGYQSHNYQFFTSSVWGGFPSGAAVDFNKGATVALCKISTTGSKTFIQSPDYIERISQFSLFVSGNIFQIVGTPIDNIDLTRDDVILRSYSNGWLPQTKLGPGRSSSLSILNNKTIMSMPDFKIHVLDTPVPTDVPPPCTPKGKSGKCH